MYQITDYTKRKAKQLGVEVRPSTNPKKKIDVFKHERKLASIGASGYMDYPSYLSTIGKAKADERRRLYKLRHEKDRHKPNTAGWFASNLLW